MSGTFSLCRQVSWAGERKHIYLALKNLRVVRAETVPWRRGDASGLFENLALAYLRLAGQADKNETNDMVYESCPQ